MKRVIFAAYALVFLLAPARSDAGIMEDIIENVRANEALYKNIEVVLDIEYRRIPQDSKVLEYTDREKGDYRYVLQNNLLYFKFDREGIAVSKEVVKTGSLRGFDGQTTRVLEQNTFGNIIEGRAEDTRLTAQLPHLFLFRRPPALVRCPLSVYLRGGDDLRKQPNFSDKNVKTKFECEETVDGLRCFKVRCILWTDDWKKTVDENICQFLWLAQDRNYLPIKTEWHFGEMGSHPERTGRCEDLREIAPGIWFPFSASYECYDSSIYLEKNQIQLDNTDKLRVSKASLNPAYDISLFRNIKFPKGITVYTIKDGKGLKSHIEGGDPSAAVQGPKGRIAVILVLSTIIAFFLGMFWFNSKQNVGYIQLVAGK